MSTSASELGDLRDTLRRALQTSAVDGPPTPDPDWRATWADLAGLGLVALCVPEDLGGFGSEVTAALVVGRELGAALHGGPYAGAVVAAMAIAHGMADPQRGGVLAAIAAGGELPTVALLDPGAVIDASAPSDASGNGVLVDGLARTVAGAHEADAFLVIGADALAYVKRTERCHLVADHGFDVTRSCADVRFERAPGLAVSSDHTFRARAEVLLGLLLAADALGGLERTMARTVAHTRTRHAFGRPIGGFQAVQHRLVDHVVAVRGMVLLAEQAAEQLTLGVPSAHRSALLTQAAVASGAVAILHDLLQLTGAIGFTWEYGLHLYERRAHLDARLARNPRRAQIALATLEGWRS